MRGSTPLLSVAALSLLAAISDAIDLVKKSTPAVVEFSIERKRVARADNEQEEKEKRQDSTENTVVQELDNEKTLYFCNITLGDTEQELRVPLDTGSSDLWVNTPDSSICRNSARDVCSEGGTYDPEDSSSYEIVSQDFNISYVDGTHAVGDYVTDTFGIGGISLDSFQFGVGIDSTSPHGVLGIGYPLNEVQSARNDEEPYPNLPQALVDEGYIQSMAYSLWLNDLSANTGQIMFGGVNSAKYHGSLQTIPVLARNGVYSELTVAMSGLTVNNGDDNTQEISSDIFPVPVLLDSGSTLSYLPESAVSEIFAITEATWERQAGAAFVPCDMANSESTFDFSFSDITISVDMTELVVDPSTDGGGRGPTFGDGTPACYFGIAPTQGSVPILGDTFLRSAYVVYDLANNEVSMASTRFNATEDDIHEIGTGSDSVPDATGVSSPVTSAELTGTGGPNLGMPDETGNGIITQTPSPDSDSGAANLHSDVLLDLVAWLAGAAALFAAI